MNGLDRFSFLFLLRISATGTRVLFSFSPGGASGSCLHPRRVAPAAADDDEEEDDCAHQCRLSSSRRSCFVSNFPPPASGRIAAAGSLTGQPAAVLRWHVVQSSCKQVAERGQADHDILRHGSGTRKRRKCGQSRASPAGVGARNFNHQDPSPSAKLVGDCQQPRGAPDWCSANLLRVLCSRQFP